MDEVKVVTNESSAECLHLAKPNLICVQCRVRKKLYSAMLKQTDFYEKKGYMPHICTSTSYYK